MTMRNRARCRRCDAVIESKHRHDFVSCRCGAIAIDGGLAYQRRLGDPADFLPAPNDDDNRNVSDGTGGGS